MLNAVALIVEFALFLVSFAMIGSDDSRTHEWGLTVAGVLTGFAVAVVVSGGRLTDLLS